MFLCVRRVCARAYIRRRWNNPRAAERKRKLRKCGCDIVHISHPSNASLTPSETVTADSASAQSARRQRHDSPDASPPRRFVFVCVCAVSLCYPRDCVPGQSVCEYAHMSLGSCVV